MSYFEILLSLESEHLEIWKEKTEYVGVTIQYKVRYKNCKIKAGNSVVDECGKGKTIEDACVDYIRKIRGKTLVFDAFKDTERVVKVFSCEDGTNENEINANSKQKERFAAHSAQLNLFL